VQFMASSHPRSIRISLTVYRLLLLLYPPSHRRQYGPLMRQLFRDLCRDAFAQNGTFGLARLWLRTLPDLAESVAAACLEAIAEVLMTLNRSVAPVSWGYVALVVLPGLLFGLSRVIDPLGVPAGLSFLLVAILAVGVLVLQRRLPIWGLLALGMLTGWALQWISSLLPGELTQGLLRLDLPAALDLGNRLVFSPNLQRWIIAVPVWLVIIWLLWKYRQLWRSAAWAVLLLGLAIVGAGVLVDVDILLYAGWVLLPVALGLPLSRQYGSLATLFMLGVFSYLMLFDSDYYSGPILNTQPFYPLFVIPLVWMLVSVAPLLLLRAQTLRGRAIGLLAPALVWGTARIAVPLLFNPELHPPAIWLGEALSSAFVLFVLALTFYLYSQPGNPITPSQVVQASQTAYTG
jgi:hypothetical protein